MEPDLYRTQVHKFSTKPSGHNAARQRENQRRHRARVKDRIAELESALSGTQSRLDDALRYIERLTGEVQRLQHTLDSTPQQQATASQTPTPESLPGSNPFPLAIAAEISATKRDRIQQASCGIDVSNPTERYRLRPRPCATCREAIGVDACPAPAIHAASSPSRPQDSHDVRARALAEAQDNILPSSSLDDPNNDCPLLPPPSTGESTIPCRDAYTVIKDRGDPEFDVSVANEWLKPGFRRAIVPGTGCRVQTHILFAFVDHITPI